MSDSALMPEVAPIDLGAAVFAHWRDQARAGTRVPLPLRRIACLLCRHEPIDAVAAGLELPVATLRRWQAVHADDIEFVDELATVAPSASFVALPPIEMTTVSLSPAPTTTTLLVERPDGVRFHIAGPLDVATLVALIGRCAP